MESQAKTLWLPQEGAGRTPADSQAAVAVGWPGELLSE